MIVECKNNRINDCYPGIKCLARWGQRVSKNNHPSIQFWRTPFYYTLQKANDCIIISSPPSLFNHWYFSLLQSHLFQTPNLVLYVSKDRELWDFNLKSWEFPVKDSCNIFIIPTISNCLLLGSKHVLFPILQTWLQSLELLNTLDHMNVCVLQMTRADN